MPTRRAVVLMSIAVVSALSAGCSTYSPGGSGFADDAYTYPSTSHLPQTVTLVDTRTGQTLWTYEVPVGRQLTVRFFEGREPDNANTPDEMYWEEMELGTHRGGLDNSMLVPNAGNRRLEVLERTIPEMPAEMNTGASAAR